MSTGNTGVGSLSLLQGIFPTQESNWGLLYCRWILYQLSYQGNPDNAQNSLSQASTVHELWNSRCSSWILKRQRNRDQIANIHWIIKKKKNKGIPEKYLPLLNWFRQSLWLCRSTDCGKLLKKWEYQTTLPTSWEICMQVKKQQLEPDMEKQTNSILGKEYWRPYIVTLII